MKERKKRTRNRGYWLTGEAIAILAENRPVPFALTGEGVEFVQDCKAKLGAIAADDNLPAPKAEKSHIDHIFEEIELYEQESLKKAEIATLYSHLERLQGFLPTIPLSDDRLYASTVNRIRIVRDMIYRLEQS